MTDQHHERMRGVARAITETYRTVGAVNLIGESELPSRRRVADLLGRLLAVTFPGYFGERISPRASLETFVAAQLDRAADELGGMIAGVLHFCGRHDVQTQRPLPVEAPGELSTRELSDAADGIVLDYLARLPEVRQVLKTDVQAAYEGDPAAVGPEEVILCYPGLLAVAVHRLAHPLYELGIPLLPRVMSEWAHSRTGVDIHPGARIGPSFFIDHGTGVVVGETTEIGRGVKLYQGVTLGALSFRRAPDGSLVKGGKRHPTLEDEVTVYASATILGGETVIGRGAVIGGGCWITESVPAGAKVMTRVRTVEKG